MIDERIDYHSTADLAPLDKRGSSVLWQVLSPEGSRLWARAQAHDRAKGGLWA